MVIRDVIKGLLRDLSSEDEDVLQGALLNARLLLEQSYLHLSAQRAVRDDDLRKGLPTDYEQRRPQQIHEEFRSLLPETYLDLVLTDEETDAITGMLLRLLNGPPQIAARAAAALDRCTRLYAVSKLAEVVRQYAPVDGSVTRSAIFALEDILASVDPRHPLTPEQGQTITEAYVALRFAAAEGIEGVWNAREAAERALSRISGHFGRSF